MNTVRRPAKGDFPWPFSDEKPQPRDTLFSTLGGTLPILKMTGNAMSSLAKGHEDAPKVLFGRLNADGKEYVPFTPIGKES